MMLHNSETGYVRRYMKNMENIETPENLLYCITVLFALKTFYV